MDKKEFSLRAIVLSSFAIVLFAFLGLNGTLSSGFHFVDNHEVVQINKDVSDANGNVAKVLTTWVKNDLGGRFRPMYMADNVIVDTLFHGNFFLISIYHAILMVLIAFFLFLSLRKIGFNVIESVAFPLIAFIGHQSAILWRLGPNESIGMWYLSLTLISMVYAVKSENRKYIFQILFVVFSSLTLLCKESFLLLTPAIILIYFFLELTKNEMQNWKTIISKHLVEFSILIIIFISSLTFVLKNVNTESLGYAGIKGVEFRSYLNAFTTLFFSGKIGLISLLFFLISCVTNYFVKYNKEKTLLNHFFLFIIVLAIVLPQVYIYGKSGIFERYFLPGILGWALMLIYSLNSIRQIIIFKFDIKYLKVYFVFEILLISFMLLPRVVKESEEAKIFTEEGRNVNEVFSFIIENADSTETILFIADPVTDFERTFSFRRYLNCTAGLKKLYTCPIIQPNMNNFEKGLIKDFGNTIGGEKLNFYKLSNKNIVKLVVVFPLLSNRGNQTVKDLGYNLSDFTFYKKGSYHLYLRKN